MEREDNREVSGAKAAAKMLGISPFVIKYWVKESKIPFRRNGRKLIFTVKDLRTAELARDGYAQEPVHTNTTNGTNGTNGANHRHGTTAQPSTDLLLNGHFDIASLLTPQQRLSFAAIQKMEEGVRLLNEGRMEFNQLTNTGFVDVNKRGVKDVLAHARALGRLPAERNIWDPSDTKIAKKPPKIWAEHSTTKITTKIKPEEKKPIRPSKRGWIHHAPTLLEGPLCTDILACLAGQKWMGTEHLRDALVKKGRGRTFNPVRRALFDLERAGKIKSIKKIGNPNHPKPLQAKTCSYWIVP
jgi:hypothetical protein